MALLPINWDAPRDAPHGAPDEQFRAAVLEAIPGAQIAAMVIMDGKMHRFKVEGDKSTEKSGWYCVYGDGLFPAGAFGSWRHDISKKWRADIGRAPTLEELEFARQKAEAAREAQRAEEKRRKKAAAEKACEMYESLPDAPNEHPYLIRKGVKAHGLKLTPEGALFMPVMVDVDAITSSQMIFPDGSKRFQPGGALKGAFFPIPATAQNPSRKVYLVEGYATGASVWEALHGEANVFVCLNAGNLQNAAVRLSEILHGAEFVVVADNDKSGIGQAKAKEAAEAVGGVVITPPEEGQDANDYAQSGGDLRALLTGEREWFPMTRARDFLKRVAVPHWIIDRYLLAGGIQMDFGASGSGKSFVEIDKACCIACPSIADWHGERIDHGRVVYLAGEDSEGVKLRVIGWMQYKGVTVPPDLVVSDGALDLDDESGTNADKLIAKIRQMCDEDGSGAPVWIVIDTLARFMSGDENKAQDSKLLIDAAAKFKSAFGCAVTFVHHTGLNPDAKNRARGSSAWKGAMDMETRISCSSGSDIISIAVTKAKNSLQPEKTLKKRVFELGPDWRDQYGRPVTTLVLEDCDGTELEEEPKKSLSRAEHRGLQTWRDAAKQAGKIIDGHLGVHVDDWRNFFYASSTEDNVLSKRQTFHRIRKKLVESGELSVNDDFYFRAGFAADLEEAELMEAKEASQNP